MSIKSLPIEDVTVVLRRAFEAQVDGNGAPVADKTGQPVYVAEAVVPGSLTSRYNLADRPEAVRIKVVGNCPTMTAPSIVRLVNARVTAWYAPRQRGNDARSDVTITAERVEIATGQTPATRGGLAAHTGGVPFLFLGQHEDVCDVMACAEGPFTVDGVSEVKCSSVVPVELVGQVVQLVGLRAYFAAPDREDVSARSKAELILSCSSIVRADAAPSTNGRSKREPVTVPAVDVAPSEG